MGRYRKKFETAVEKSRFGKPGPRRFKVTDEELFESILTEAQKDPESFLAASKALREEKKQLEELLSVLDPTSRKYNQKQTRLKELEMLLKVRRRVAKELNTST